MMKILALCFVYFAFLTIVHSQEEFAPPGAEWIFSYSQFNYEGFEYITYDRDTIIDGESTKILSRLRRYVDINAPTDTIEENISDAYIRQEGDQIFQYYLDSFHLIFDFGWSQGIRHNVVNNEGIATMGGSGPELAQISIFIDTTYITLIGDKELNVLDGRVTCPGIDISFRACIRLLESIGPTDRYLFYTENSCDFDSPPLFLKSYSVDGISIYSSEEECPNRLIVALQEAALEESTIRLYPNPVKDNVHIKLLTTAKSFAIQELYLYNHIGKEMINIKKPLPSHVSIDLSDSPTGIYYLKIIISNNTTYIKKLIKI